MSPKPETRQVCVLEPFRDRQGKDWKKGDTFAAAYETPLQQRAVNEMMHRGFLTFEVQHAARLSEDREREEVRRQAQAPRQEPAEEHAEPEPEQEQPRAEGARSKRSGRRA